MADYLNQNIPGLAQAFDTQTQPQSMGGAPVQPGPQDAQALGQSIASKLSPNTLSKIGQALQAVQVPHMQPPLAQAAGAPFPSGQGGVSLLQYLQTLMANQQGQMTMNGMDPSVGSQIPFQR